MNRTIRCFLDVTTNEDGSLRVKYESILDGEGFEANYDLDSENTRRIAQLLAVSMEDTIEKRIREKFFIAGEEPSFCGRFCSFMDKNGIRYASFSWY